VTLDACMIWSLENRGSVGYVFEPTCKMDRRTLMHACNTGKLMIAATTVWMGCGDLIHPVKCDIDGDGDVDPFDFSEFRVNYGSIM